MEIAWFCVCHPAIPDTARLSSPKEPSTPSSGTAECLAICAHSPQFSAHAVSPMPFQTAEAHHYLSASLTCLSISCTQSLVCCLPASLDLCLGVAGNCYQACCPPQCLSQDHGRWPFTATCVGISKVTEQGQMLILFKLFGNDSVLQ